MEALTLVMGLSAGGVLLASGTAHVSALDSLASVLRIQGIFTDRLVRKSAGVVAVSELVAGSMTVAVLGFFGAAPRLVAAGSLGAAALLYLAFTVYTGILVKRGVRGPCGCGRSETTPMSLFVVSRSALLCAAAVFAFATVLSAGPEASLCVCALLTLEMRLGTLLVAGGVGFGIWLLPRLQLSRQDAA